MAAPALDFDPKWLEGYLKARLPELEGKMTVVRIGGGQSNPTYRLTFASGEVILRKQPSGELLPSAHAVDREFRVQSALAATDVPVPPMLLLCEDRAVIGTLFYVMAALDGRVVHDSSIPGATPAERALDVRRHERRARPVAQGRLARGRSRGLRPAGQLLRPPDRALDPRLARVEDARDPGTRPSGRLAAGARSGRRRHRASSTATSASAT